MKELFKLILFPVAVILFFMNVIIISILFILDQIYSDQFGGFNYKNHFKEWLSIIPFRHSTK